MFIEKGTLMRAFFCFQKKNFIARQLFKKINIILKNNIHQFIKPIDQK